MWWKICKILFVLILLAGAALMLVLRIQPAKTVLPSEAPSVSERKMTHADDATISEAATPAPEAYDEAVSTDDSLEVISGNVEFCEWGDWRALYGDLTHFPDAKVSYDVDNRFVKEQYTVTNAAGEFMILGRGRIAYSESWSEENKNALQLYEIIADTLGALSDRTFIKERKSARTANLNEFSRQDAERMAGQWVSAHLPAMYDGVVVLDGYGFSETKLSELHKALRSSELIYPFRDPPQIPEGGVYYVELAATIGGKPVVAETYGRRLRLRYNEVTSTYEYLPLEAYVIVSRQGVIHAELSSLFSAAGEMETVRAITAEEAIAAYRGQTGRRSASPETQLQYVIARQGTGITAKYALKPVWHVFEDDEAGEIANGYYFDALTGEYIWEICDISGEDR